MLTKTEMEPCGSRCRTCLALRRAVETTAAEAGVAGVSIETLAVAVQQPADVVGQHVGDLSAFVRATYAGIIGELMEHFVRDLWTAPSWPDGLTYAVPRHVERLVADPARARLCYLEFGSDPDIRRDTEEYRAQAVDMLSKFQRTVAPDAVVPLVRVELVYGAVTHMIELHVQAGTLAELPAQMGDLLEALEPDALRFSA